MGRRETVGGGGKTWGKNTALIRKHTHVCFFPSGEVWDEWESFLAPRVTGQTSRTSCSEAGGRRGAQQGRGWETRGRRERNGWGAMGTGRRGGLAGVGLGNEKGEARNEKGEKGTYMKGLHSIGMKSRQGE